MLGLIVAAGIVDSMDHIIDRLNHRKFRGRSGPEIDGKHDLVLRFLNLPFWGSMSESTAAFSVQS